MTAAAVAAPPTVADDVARPAGAETLAFVDALRGIAILGVIVVHHSQVFRGLGAVQGVAAYGQMGVQLFFVASAFTLCRSAQARGGERHGLRNFYLRRFFRIAPLYWLAIAGYGLLDAGRRVLGRAGGESSYEPANILLNLLFVHGFSPAAYNSVVPGGWSISTEMMFYLIFPALLPVVAATYRRHGRPALIAWPLAGVALSLCAQAWLGQGMRNNDWLFCNIVNQLSVFLLGIAAFLRIADGGFAPRPVRDALGFGIATAVAALLLLGAGEGVPAPLELALAPVAAAVSFAFLLNLGRAGLFDRARLLLTIGRLSYSMYICHFLFAWAGTNLVLRTVGTTPTAQALLYLPTLLLVIAASMGVAMLTKPWIEDPGIALGKRLIRRLDAR